MKRALHILKNLSGFQKPERFIRLSRLTLYKR